MQKGWTFAFIFASLLTPVFAVGVCPGWVARASADEIITSATPDIIADLKNSAEKDRVQVAAERKRADAWRNMAAGARQSAADSLLPADKKSWEEQADAHAARAAAIEATITKLNAQIAEKEARAARLQAALDAKNPPAPTTSTMPETPEAQPKTAASGDGEASGDEPFQLDYEDVIGVWRPVADGDWPFVIVPEDPNSKAYRYKVEAHTKERVWKGLYSSFPDGHVAKGDKKGRVRLTYTPKAVEMNPDIPEWARKAVEGKLEWRIELSEAQGASTADPRMVLKWFPGEVKWRDDSKTAEVIGEGVPREIEIGLETVMEVEEMAAPTLWVEKVGATPDELPEQLHIAQLLKHQPFNVKVRLPAALAQKAGSNIAVQVKDNTGGKSTTIALQGVVVPNRPGPVTYKNPKPVSIADPGTEPDLNPKLMSIGWIANKYAREDEEGNRIDLWARDASQIEFRYGETFQQVTLYESWLTERLADHATKLALLREMFGAILSDPEASKAKKEEAVFSMRMLNNYAALEERDDLLPQHKYALGELYLMSGSNGAGLLCTGQDCGISGDYDKPIVYISRPSLDSMVRNVSPPKADPKYYITLVKGFMEAVQGKEMESAAVRTMNALPWAARGEQHLVAMALAAASDKVAGDLQSSVGDTVLAAPLGLANEVSIILTAKDLSNKSITGWQRQVTAARFIAQLLMSEVSGMAMGATLKLRGNTIRKLGAPITARSTLRLRAAARGATQEEGFHAATLSDDMPKTLKENQLADTALRLESDPETSGMKNYCRLADDDDNMGASPKKISTLTREEAQQVGESIYGKNYELVGDEIQPPQMDSTCVAATGNTLIEDGTGTKMGEGAVIIAAAQRAEDVMHKRMQRANFKDKKINEQYMKLAGLDPTDIVQALMGQGIPTAILRDILREKGASVGEVPIRRNHKTNVRQIGLALDRGYQVFVGIDLSTLVGQKNAFHAIRVTKLVRDGSGQVIKVRFFEPNNGRLGQLPLAEFERLIARNKADGSPLSYGNMMVIRWDGQPWSALKGVRATPKPAVIPLPPKTPAAPAPSKPKPTIQYPNNP